MDITKQFQKFIGKTLERIERAQSFYHEKGDFTGGYDSVNNIFKEELWELHDLLKLQIENERLKSKVGE